MPIGQLVGSLLPTIRLVPSGAGFFMDCGMDEQGKEMQYGPSILKTEVFYIDHIVHRIQTMLIGQLVSNLS